MRNILCGSVVLLSVSAVLFTFPAEAGAPPAPLYEEVQTVVSRQILPASLFFVGDIMLGRGVEMLMETHGGGYPFLNVERLIGSSDLTIGNFEGIIPQEHIPTPSMGFQFSVRNEYLTKLREVGFDVLSLANNHSLDYGKEALAHTRELCRALGIVCGGAPDVLGKDSLILTKVNEHTVGFVFLSAVWKELDREALEELLASVDDSVFLVAYVHWGEEYVFKHSEREEELAHVLIDRGVDAVIGHHPHVVQDVELYRGRPVFYSLGNFIFDQYFSEDVMEGLGISVTLTENTARYRLVPFRNDTAPSQPHPVSRSEAEALFSRILEGVADVSGVDSREGIITIPR